MNTPIRVPGFCRFAGGGRLGGGGGGGRLGGWFGPVRIRRLPGVGL